MVPTTSAHWALSMATATLCAPPVMVLITVSEGPAVSTSRTKPASGANASGCIAREGGVPASPAIT